MAPQAPDAGAWVLSAVDAMQRSGSWTGRIHVQKLLFVIEVLGLAKTPFEFKLYDYGPYSLEVDETFIDLEMFGRLVREYRKPGYGPSYHVTPEEGVIADRLSPIEQAAISRVAQALGARSSRALELLATCLWVVRKESQSNDDAIIDRVAELKPRYTRDDIRQAMSDMRKVVGELSSCSS